MSGRAKRRRERKKKAQRARQPQQGLTQSNARLVDQLQRRVDMLARYSDGGADPEGAISAARSDLAELSGKVVGAACGLDVITAVASVQATMAMRRSATGEDLPAAILELGAAHPDTLEVRLQAAIQLGEAHMYGEAVRRIAELVDDSTRMHGPDHHETLRVRQQYAAWTDPARRASTSGRAVRGVARRPNPRPRPRSPERAQHPVCDRRANRRR